MILFLQCLFSAKASTLQILFHLLVIAALITTFILQVRKQGQRRPRIAQVEEHLNDQVCLT